MSPRVEAREGMWDLLDDTFYDASEEESDFEIDMEIPSTLEQPVPILDAPPRGKKSADSKPTQKTLPAQTLARVLAGYSTSDDDEDGAQRQQLEPRRVLLFRRASSCPKSLSPSSPKTAHDSAVQGIADSASGSAREGRPRKRRRKFEGYVLTPVHDEAAALFQGVADADSSQERWRQITLEEHMDKIFNAMPPPVGEGTVERADAVIEGVARVSIGTEDVRQRPEGKRTRFRERMLSLMRLFGCGWRFKRGEARE